MYKEPCRLDVKFIKNIYSIRLFYNDKLHSQVGCDLKEDISFCCAYLLRWVNKVGMESEMADAARNRMNRKKLAPIGKIYYHVQNKVFRHLKERKGFKDIVVNEKHYLYAISSSFDGSIIVYDQNGTKHIISMSLKIPERPKNKITYGFNNRITYGFSKWEVAEYIKAANI